MNKKYQIFVSSTYEDLKHERDQVIKAVLELGHIPVGMEMFSAADSEQWALIRRQIDDCDYYAVIIAHRYGSLAEGMSYTEKEYDYAISKSIPTIAFILSDSAPWPENKRDNQTSALENFKIKLRRKMVGHWTTTEDLYGKFTASFAKLMGSHPMPGWARANEIAGPQVVKELSRLSSENAELRKELSLARDLAKSEAENERAKLNTALKRNHQSLSFFYKDSKNWENETQFSLFRLFILIAPELMIEKSTAAISNFTGLMLNPDKKRKVRDDFPVASNRTKNWLADLVCFELVEPSPRKHSIKDTEEYWSLTNVGRDLHSHIRRLVLENEGLDPKIVAPADPNDRGQEKGFQEQAEEDNTSEKAKKD